jgi:hypothetical protein
MPSRDATTANDRGRALAREARYADAIPHYLEAVRLAPSWCIPWFNLGIAYKQTADFAGSLRACERAIAIDAKEAGEAALWNLGIAATALGDWEKARKAWRAFGLKLPDGEGPIEMRGTMTPMRLNPRGDAEVVWSLRIDPARARLRSVPLPGSGHRYDDLILHDGAPNGYREVEGQKLPVFDQLALLEPSRYETWQASVVVPGEPDLLDLQVRVDEVDMPFEDWSEVRMLCKACSEGTPHEHPGEGGATEWRAARTIGLGVLGTDPGTLLQAWASSGPGRSVSSVTRVL